jgi:septal ring factor EnvC (AmiA/AmiB activator)
MDASTVEAPKAEYTTPHRVQAWFLGRSRDRWKEKYMDLKAEAGRLERRVADVTKSREKWRHEAQELRRRIQELEVQTVALQEQTTAFRPKPNIRVTSRKVDGYAASTSVGSMGRRAFMSR